MEAAFVLNAARSIALAKRIQMDNERLYAYIGLAMVAIVLISAIMEITKAFKTTDESKPESALNGLPAGTIIVLPKAG